MDTEQPKYFAVLITQIQDLRKSFAGASARQRLGVAIQRINEPPAIPNRLVTIVSAVEAFARSLAAHAAAETGEEVIEAHRRRESKDAPTLIVGYLKSKKVTPAAAFGEEKWAGLRVAMKIKHSAAPSGAASASGVGRAVNAPAWPEPVAAASPSRAVALGVIAHRASGAATACPQRASGFGVGSATLRSRFASV